MPARAKILIVDDDPESLGWLGALVRQQGHEPVQIAGGAEALAALDRTAVDVVLLDLRTPGASGLAFLDELAARGLTPALPVVVATDATDRDARLAALDRGAADYLCRPFDGREVEARLRALVALRRPQAAPAGHARDRASVLAAVLAGAPMAIAVLDEAGRVVEANAAAEALVEPERSPLVGKLATELVAPVHAPEIEAAIAGLVAGGPPVTLTLPVPVRDGEIQVEASGSAVETERGRVVVVVGRDVTAETRARRELAEREAELRHAQAVAHIGSIHVDLGTHQRRWSDETLRILGLPPGSTVDAERDPTVVVDEPPDLASALVGAVGGASSPHEHRVVVDGEVRWIATEAEVETDADGAPRAVLATVQDVTHRKVMQLALEDSLRFTRGILDSLAEQVAIVDERGVIIATNRAWREGAVRGGGTLAATSEGASYLAACEGTPEGEAVAKGIRRAIAGETDYTEVEYRCDTPTELRWYSCRIRRFDGEGPPRVVIAHVDVSRMKRAQLESAEHAQRLAMLVTNLPLVLWEAVVGHDGAFEMRWVSANVDRVLGVDADKLLGRGGWTSYVHPADLPHLRSLNAGAAASEQWLEQYRWVSPSGAVVHLQAGITTRPGIDGSTLILGFALDVSDAKQLEETLLQAGKMDALGQLTGGIAHDFNNLLAVILSFTGFVHADLAEGDVRRDDLDEVLRAANKGVDLIRQLLIFSHQQPLAKQPLDLNRSLAGLTKMLQRSVGEDIELVVVPSARAAVVYMDPVQVDQVLMNLAVNARDAMPGGGQLRFGVSHPAEQVGVFAPGRCVRVVVSDTGEGMDEVTLDRIFEPFFTTKPVGKGTGLGLATCYAIIRNAGGTIRVTSEPGRGSTFTIDLPICDLPVASALTSVAASLHAAGERVLVVEDDAALRKAAVRILESAGYRVSQARDGNEAVQWLDDPGHEVDLIFTDVVMPGRGGYSVASHAKARAPGARVLLTSGYLDGRAAPDSNVDQLPLLWKPYTPASLLHAAHDALDARRSAPRATPPARRPTAAVSGGVVLLVDDDAPTRTALRRTLVRQGGYEVVTAENLADARAALAPEREYVAVVCDLSLPDGSGADLVRWLRTARPALARSTIVLTGGVVDDAGRRLVADGETEVLSKPIGPGLLLERLANAVAQGAAAPRRAKATSVGMAPQDSGRPVATSNAEPPRRPESSWLIERSAASSDEGGLLLVEDDARERDMYARALRAAKLTVTTASSGEEAVVLLGQHRFDAVVTDLGLPGVDGLAVLRAAHALDADLPVLLVTGVPSTETAASAADGGAFGYLVKPVSLTQLIREVELAIQVGEAARHQSRRAVRDGAAALAADLVDTRAHFVAAMSALRVVYQPIVRSHDHSVFGYEALLRCDEPTMSSAAKVFAAAEVLGRTDDVGLAVRDEILRTLERRPGRHETIFANLHPRELRGALLCAANEPLRRCAPRVVLEVSERASLGSAAHLQEQVRLLHQAGYRIAIDNLSEGRAGLSCLARLQPDIAKIDLSAVRDAPRSPLKREILASLVSACRRAGITVAAAGVETEEEVYVLTDLGCDLLQGHFFAQPGPAFPAVQASSRGDR